MAGCVVFQGFRRENVETGDAVIHCVIGGSGPPVLLLHGFPQTHVLWAKIAPLLAARYTVVAADLRGYGDSSKPALLYDHSNYAFRAFANDNVAVMAHFGFDRFHMIGHDRGGRTGHRMALDHSDSVLSLSVLDIVPTYAMLMDTNREVAGAYWHWYFLSLPAPFPERLIASDPDYFYQTSLVGWGKTRLEDFDPEQLGEYRRCWREPATIQGMTNDYRAATTIDLAHDAADIDRKVACPTLALWGSAGVMHGLFDMEAEWRKRCSNLTCATLPGGHFFPDVLPSETAACLLAFLDAQV